MRVTSLTDHRTQTLCICNFDQIKNYTGLYDAIKKYVIQDNGDGYTTMNMLNATKL